MSNKEKILKIIVSLSSKERTRFLKYLDLEYGGSVFITYFHLIFKYKQNLTNQIIFQHLYPTENYRDDRIRLLLSRAMKVILGYLELSSKSKIEKLETSHRQLKSLKTTEFKNKITTQLNTDITSYGYEVNFEMAAELSESIISEGNRAIEPKLQETHNSLDEYYFIEKLKLACNAQNYSNMSGHNYNLGFLDSVILYLENYSMKDKPLLFLYFHTYKMIKEASESHFLIVYDFLKSISIPEHNDYREILLTMLNFSIQRLNRGNMDERYRIFQLYQWQIQSNNIYIYQKLPSNTYKNVVNLALNIKEFDWTLQFIESEKNKLISAHPIEDYQLVMAKYYYETGNYEDCIQLITMARPLDILDNLLLRVLQCKAYYELDNYEMIDNSIHNAKLYLLRHKSKAYQYLIFKNFFSILKKILQSSQTLKSKEKLKKELDNMKLVAEKKWLMELVK